MSYTFDFNRTFVRYAEDGRWLDVPIAFESLDPYILGVGADFLDHWTSDPSVPLDPAKRAEILDRLRKYLDDSGAIYTIHEEDYLRARSAPYTVVFEGTRQAPVLVYTRGNHRLEALARFQLVGPIVVRTRGLATWTRPAGAPLSPAELAAVEADIRALKPHVTFE